MQIQSFRSPLITLSTCGGEKAPQPMKLDVTKGGKIGIQPASPPHVSHLLFIRTLLCLRQGGPGRCPEPYLSHWGNSATGYDISLTAWAQNLVEMGGILTF